MPYPVASGVPSHSGNYTPTIFAKKMLVKFYRATVFGSIANTDYEGEIKDQGDTVEIRTLPDVTISDYVKGAGLGSAENLAPSTVTLNIDKGKSYNVNIFDVDRVQSDLAFQEKWAGDAGQQLKIAVDGDILVNMVGEAHASNKGAEAGAISGSVNLGTTGSPVSITKANVVDYLVNMGLVMDEMDIPDEDRWAVFPAWMCARIKTSELKDASLTGDGKSTLRNGRIGMVDRFTIYSSNSIHHVTDTVECFYPFAGHKSSLTFASQLLKNETLKNPNDFGDIMRGLQVFGWKVIKPEGLVEGYVTAGTVSE
jgi:hypothetical protein